MIGAENSNESRAEEIAKDPYSAQTRQTRTALMVTSSTLLISSTVGHFPANTIIFPPFNYTVDVTIFYWLIAGTVVYFLASFFVSAVHERQPYRYAKHLLKAKESFAAHVSTLGTLTPKVEDSFDANASGYTEVNSLMSAINAEWSRLKAQIEAVDRLKGQRRVRDIDDALARIDQIAKNRMNISPDGEQTAFMLTRDELLRTIGDHENECKRWITKVESDERQLRNWAAAKNDYLEFFAPLIYGIIAIACFGKLSILPALIATLTTV